MLTLYSAILSELPKPSPSLSPPEYTPTTYTGELEKRPVSFSNLYQGACQARLSSCVQFAQTTYLDTGFSLPNFATVSNRAFFGSRNLIMLRRSTSLLKKYLCTNFRADSRERFL